MTVRANRAPARARRPHQASRHLGPGRSRVSAAATCLGLIVAVAVTAPSAHAQTLLTAVGDSITAGTGDSVPEGPNAGYPSRLEQLVTSVSILNAGVPGEKTFELLARLDSVLAQGGDALLLMEGTNDISRDTPVESIVFNLGEIAERAEDEGFEVIHATVIPRLPSSKTDGANILNRQLNQGIRDLAGRRGRRLADNFEVFWQIPDRFDRYYWDNPNDPVGHPNPDGYDLMARTFADVLLGLDTLAPVPGALSPQLGAADVAPDATIVVDLWDFGTGIDVPSAELLVDGEEIATLPSSGSRRVTFRYQPEELLAGVVEVAVRARDRATPAHEIDRVVSRFAVIGSAFLSGDFDASGAVDDVDLVQLSLAFGSFDGEIRYSPDADLDDDGTVDGVDLAILASNYGQQP